MGSRIRRTPVWWSFFPHRPQCTWFWWKSPKDQILFLLRGPLYMTQAMVKTGKPALLLTHLQYILQIPNRMVRVKTLRQQQTYVIMVVENKHLSQTRTMKLNTNLCNIHHRSRLIPFRRLKSTILLQKKFCRTYLETQVVNTTYGIILILTTQIYRDTDMCNKSITAPISVFLSSFLFSAHT